jgi:hypothetical protein
MAEIPKEEVLQLLRKPNGYTEDRTFKLIDTSFQTVTGHDGQHSVLHVRLSLVHTRSLQTLPTVTRELLLASKSRGADKDPVSAERTGRGGAGGGGQEDAGGCGQELGPGTNSQKKSLP